MAGKKPDEVLTIGVGLEADAALKHMAKFERAMRAQLKQVGSTSKKETRASVDGFKRMADAVDDLTDSTDKYEKVLKGLRQRASEASDEAVEGLEEQIDLVEKIIQKNREARKHAPKKEAAREDPKEAKREANSALKESAMAFRDAASSFFSKDAKGVFGGLMKTLGAGLKGSLKRAELGSTNIADKLGSTGLGIATRGKEKGGAGGTAMAGVGKALQGLGGMFAKLGPMLNTVAKLGPLLGVASSALMAVVKIFIDAEAQAKQFQKEVLASASTAEILAANGGDAGAAFTELETTMRGIRDAAHSWDNLKWGIKAEEHKAVINVLTQEGVTIKRIGDEAKMSGQDVQSFAAELTHVSVAYSRAFGVPLQEINQLQAELMTEMGRSLDETKLAFAQMTREATNSGVASNRFFAIIRGVSQDLSLYNTRMEQAVKLLGKLGKVMNPRNAQKFMQMATQGLKNMSQDDRLKLALLAGPKGANIVRKDIQNREQNLAKDIAQATGKHWEDVAEDLKDPKKAKELWSEVEKKAPDKLGTLRESSFNLGIDKKANKKGVYGQAFAMENLGLGASLEMQQAALAQWGGGSTLTEGAGSLGLTKMAEMMGKSTQELRGMMLVEQAVQEQKDTLLAQAVTEEDKAKVNAMGIQDVLDTMSEEERKLLKEQTKSETDYAKEQAQLTNSLLDKLEALLEFVMNQVYNVLIDIWEGILTSIPDILKTESVKSNLALIQNMKEVKKWGGSEEISKIAKEGGNIKGALAGSEAAKSWNAFLDDWTKTTATYEQDQFRKSQIEQGAFARDMTPDEKAEIAAIDKRSEDVKKRSGIMRGVLKSYGKDSLVQAMEQAGISTDKIEQVRGAQSASGAHDIFKDVMKGDTAGTADVLRKLPIWTNASWGADMAGADKQAVGMMGFISDQMGKIGYYDKDKGVATDPTDPKILEATLTSTDATAKAAEQTHETLSKDNTAYFRFSTSFLRGDYKRTMENVLLSSIRKALFEFYMYSQMDPGEVAKFLSKNGMTAEQFAETVGREAEEGRTPKDFTGGLEYTQAPGNADGGIVTGINGGLALVRAAAGEGLASVGPGERILPAGAGRGGDQFNINVAGIGGNDLARFLQVKVADGIVEYKRRQRFV